MINLLNKQIETDEIIYFLKKQVQLKEICHKVLQQEIINQVAEARNIEISEEEIQAEADKLRRQKQLEQASDTFAWLADELISAEDWEAGIHDTLATRKLAASLFSSKVEKLFRQNQHKFEQALLYQIIVPYEKLAWEIFYQVEEEEINFYHAAHLYDIDKMRRLRCGYEGTVYRYHLQPDIAALVFGAQPGKVITPFKSEQGYHIFMVEDFIPAQLTDEVHQELLSKMFEEWLESELNYMFFNKINDQDTEG